VEFRPEDGAVQLRKAYTLLELILVMTIIVIFAGLASPTIMGLFSQYRLRAGADGIQASWVGARSHAVEEGQRYRFSVVPGKGNYRVAPDSPEYWTSSLPDFNHDNPPLILEDTLPGGVVFTIGGRGGPGEADEADSSFPVGQVDPGQWQTIAVFEPDGSAQEDVSITLSCANGGARPLVVSLRALTAMSSAKMAPQ
jgi:prepilin-type N-terminal cleavage/methylation domain-containing protein